jgi:hypothetical protein
MPERKEKPLKDIPQDILDKVIRDIVDYCVPIILGQGLLGSGTLVKCGAKHGVLTAYHVAEYFGTCKAGEKLRLAIQEYSAPLSIPMQYVVKSDIGIPKSDERGPDMSFLELPYGDELSTLRAKKTFFNIGVRPQERLSFCRDDPTGIWAMAYSLGEQTSKLRFEDGVPGIDIGGGIGFTAPDTDFYEESGFDFIECGVKYTYWNKLPSTFGGASGGGLWKVPLRAPLAGEQEDTRVGYPVLAGLLFYETAREGDSRHIKCHGPKSIYENLLQALTV